MDRHLLQTIGSVGLATLCIGGTLTLYIIELIYNRPLEIPGVLENLDFVAGTAFFVNAAVQNGARSAGQSAAQVAVAAAQAVPKVV